MWGLVANVVCCEMISGSGVAAAVRLLVLKRISVGAETVDLPRVLFIALTFAPANRTADRWMWKSGRYDGGRDRLLEAAGALGLPRKHHH